MSNATPCSDCAGACRQRFGRLFEERWPAYRHTMPLGPIPLLDGVGRTDRRRWQETIDSTQTAHRRGDRRSVQRDRARLTPAVRTLTRPWHRTDVVTVDIRRIATGHL
jgi:hypothetical protein